jgi:hypothetical protein
MVGMVPRRQEVIHQTMIPAGLQLLPQLSHQMMTIQHNLNAFPTRYWIWFSPDNPPSQVYPQGRGQSPNYNPTGGWGQPHSVAFTENEMTYTLLGQTPVSADIIMVPTGKLGSLDIGESCYGNN